MKISLAIAASFNFALLRYKKMALHKSAIFIEFSRRLLLVHQKLHDNLRGVSNARTRTKDSGNAGFVEEVVVLRGDDTAGGDHDIRTAEFLEFLDDLRDEGLVTCREAGDTQYMDIVLLVGSGDP